MKIDESKSFSEEIRQYSDYVKDTINTLEEYGDHIIESVLFYKYVIKSDYNEQDLMNGTMAKNIESIIEKLESFSKEVIILKEVADFLDTKGETLKWSDFEGSELSKELLREYKINKLTK